MIADNPRASAVKCNWEGHNVFGDSLAFFNLNFGAVCPLNIEVCNTEPRPMHINATGGIIDLIRLIQQKHFFSSIKFQNYLLMSFHLHANKSPLYSEKASLCALMMLRQVSGSPMFS